MTAVQKRSSKKPSRSARSEEGPDPVDIHVGSRLRLRRNLLGLSQEQLGKASGLTFQQIQKYERGANRVSASRLFQLGQILDAPITWFYDALPEEIVSTKRRSTGERGQSERGVAPESMNAMLNKRETTDLLRAWYSIEDAGQRRKIFNLIKSMGKDA